MTKYLLDTNHVSLLWRASPLIVQRVGSKPDAELLVSRPSVGEMWFMVYKSARVRENERSLRVFLQQFNCLEYDTLAAVEFGRIKAELRQVGRPIPDIDTQIAAIARLHSLTVLSDDVHFTYVPGLAVENWLR